MQLRFHFICRVIVCLTVSSPLPPSRALSLSLASLCSLFSFFHSVSLSLSIYSLYPSFVKLFIMLSSSPRVACNCCNMSALHSSLSFTLSPTSPLSYSLPLWPYTLLTYLLIIPSSRLKIRHAHCAFSRQDFQLDFLLSLIISYYYYYYYNCLFLQLSWLIEFTLHGKILCRVSLHAACIFSQMFSVLLAQRELATFCNKRGENLTFSLSPCCPSLRS